MVSWDGRSVWSAGDEDSVPLLCPAGTTAGVLCPVLPHLHEGFPQPNTGLQGTAAGIATAARDQPRDENPTTVLPGLVAQV